MSRNLLRQVCGQTSTNGGDEHGNSHRVSAGFYYDAGNPGSPCRMVPVFHNGVAFMKGAQS